MAKVQVQILGGSIQSKEAGTVGDLKAMLSVQGHTATVNGEAQSDSYELSEYEFVSLSPAVKGGSL